MTTGDALIILGALSVLGAAVSRVLDLQGGDKRLRDVSTYLSVLAFAFVSASLILIAFYFIDSNMSFDYVWSHSSSDLSTIYKLSGVWAGAEGSILLWIWFMSLVLLVEVLLEPRRAQLGRQFHGYFQVSVSLMLFMFLLLLADMRLFAQTPHIALQMYPNGSGMSLLLQTPEMIVHPPIVFAGYAFCVAAFAAGAAYFLTNEKGWYLVSLPWARLAWMFLTLGIGIGAIWAYYVLGWGGYWAWDPVETSSLLPWLVATAFLHTQIRHARKKEYKIASPALGMLAFVSVVFATFATRAGSLWTSSVHAFGNSQGSTGGARLSYLLQNDSSVLGIFTLMVALLAVTIYLAYSKYRASERPEEAPAPERMSGYVSDRNNILMTVALLLATSAVMMLLLFKNVNAGQAANYAEFNQKMSVFFVGTMVTMSVCLMWRHIGKERAFLMGIGILGASLVLGAVAAASGSLNGLVAFSLPSYAVAVGASVFKLSRSRVAGSARKTLQAASPNVIHLGVALILLSFVVSSNMQVYPDAMQTVQGASGNVLGVGDAVEVSGYTIRLEGLSSTPRAMPAASQVDQACEATVDLLSSGHLVREGVVLTDLYGSGQVVSVEVYVLKGAMNDLYLNFQWLSNASALIQVKVIPLMNTLWAGLALLTVGLAIRTVVWRNAPMEPDPETTASPAREPVTKRAEKDYEALVEEELRKFKESRRR